MMTGTRDTGNINDDRDTGTQLQRGHRGKQGDNLTIYLYAKTMGQQRMLYIRKFYVVKTIYIYIYIYIHRWDIGTQLQWRVTIMARNDLRARGGLGGARSAPTN